jgi:hypothetical protein
MVKENNMSIPKFKQTFEVEYKYFNDNKTVVAYARPYSFINNIFITMGVNNYSLYSKIFKGVAKFKEGDTFDIKEAERIAKKKAIRAFYKYVKSLLTEDMAKQWKLISDQKEFLQQLNNKIATFTNEIKEEK